MYLLLLVISTTAVAMLTVLLFHYRTRVKQLQWKQKGPAAMIDDLNRRLAQEKTRVEEANSIAARALQQLEKQKEIARIASAIGDEQANKLMLFAKIADEFRTPLTLIIGPLENTLKEKYGAVGSEIKKHLEITVRNVRHLLRQINRFHDISKLQMGKLELKPAGKDIVKFLRTLLQLFEESADKRNIELTFRSDRESLEVFFDPEKLDEVLYHLLANALKFTSNSGRVSVSLATRQPSTEHPDGFIEISVKDTGKGIAGEDLLELLEIIQGSNRTRQYGAQRFGLALVGEFVRLHGGVIDVSSEKGMGTEFRITLPLGRSHLGGMEIIEPGSETELNGVAETSGFTLPDKEAASLSTESVRPESVLIVEDNPDIRELLKDCLKDYYEVTEATDGKDALEKVTKTAPDLIISDVLMPGMDGFDLCRTLKTDKTLHHIPVILLTAKSSDLMRIQGIEAGADAYIPKPFSPEQLLEKLKSLSRQRAES